MCGGTQILRARPGPPVTIWDTLTEALGLPQSIPVCGWPCRVAGESLRPQVGPGCPQAPPGGCRAALRPA